MKQKHIKNERQFDKSFSLTPLGLLLAACGGGGGGTATSSSTTNTTSNQTTYSYTGAVVKGPLSNSLVFLDYNNDGKLSSGEPTARTDVNGNFNLTGKSSADIVAIADSFTTDQSTGEKLSGVTLKAPNGSKVVSPTTTLMQETGLSKSEVLSALGLPSNIDPTTFNPYAAGVNASQALLYEKVSHQIVNTVKGVSSALETSGLSESEAFDEALDAVTDVIKDKSLGGGTLNFTSEADISDVIAKVDPSSASVKTKFATIKSTVSQAIDNTNEKIADVSDLTSKASKDTFALSNDLSEQIKSAGTDTAKITFSDKDKITEQLTSNTTTKLTSNTTTKTTSVDSSGPVLNSISVRDNTLNVGETLYVDFSTTEASGIEVTQVLFYDANGNQHRAEDRNNDGVAELKITSGMLSGNYTAELVSLMDKTDLNNESIYYKSGTLSGDTKSSTHSINLGSLNFSVNNTSNVDSSGPVLNSISVRDNTLSVGETLYIDYNASDTNEIDVTQILFYDDRNNQFRAEDRNNDGVAELKITSEMLSGTYRAELVSMMDETDLNNESIYYKTGFLGGDTTISSHGFNLTLLNFEVLNQYMDYEGPSLVNIGEIRPTYYLQDKIAFSYDVTDDSGISKFSYVFRNPEGSEIRIEDDDLDGIAELDIPATFMVGEYTPIRAEVTDASPNKNQAIYHYQGYAVTGDTTQTKHELGLWNDIFTLRGTNLDLLGLTVIDNSLKSGDLLQLRYDVDELSAATKINTTWFPDGGSSTDDTVLVVNQSVNSSKTLSKSITGLETGRYFLGSIQLYDETANVTTDHFSSSIRFDGKQIDTMPFLITDHNISFDTLYFDFIA